MFAADIGLLGSCITDASGECTVDELPDGDYLAIVEYVDSGGDIVYSGRQQQADDSGGGGGAAAPSAADFKIIKVMKKNGDVQLSGGKSVVV